MHARAEFLVHFLKNAGKPRFFYGWYIVLCGFLAQSMRVGLGLQTFGFFFKFMSEELGWTRAMLTGGLMTNNIIGAVLGPAIGFTVDRYGPRLLMAGSAGMLSVSLLLLSQTHSLWQFYLFYGVVGAFGLSATTFGGLNPTIAKWFVRKRGRATGIATAGVNVGGVVLTPVILFLISHYGWRAAWMVLALLPWPFVVLPSLLWLRRQPEDMGLRPDGDEAMVAPAGAPATDVLSVNPWPGIAEEVSWTAPAAFRTRALWLLLAAEFFSGMAVSGGIVHRIPYMTDQGFSNAVAATTFVIYSVFAFFSKLILGSLTDRYSVRHLTIAIMLGSALGLFCLIGAKSVWQLYLGYGVVYGIAGGAQNTLPGLIWPTYYGRQFLGAIKGLTSPFGRAAGIGGPMFAAFIYDVAESYELAFLVFVGCFVAAALLIGLARRPVPEGPMRAA